MDILDDDIINIWKSLNQNNVKYIMVGGFASVLYGVNRITHDIDLWIKDTLENRKELRKTLFQLGYGDFAELETTQIITGFCSVYLNEGIELDIMTELKSLSNNNFDECLSLATKAIIENIEVPFLHINQLIKEKETLARPKDLQDIEELNAIIKIQSKK